MSVCSSSLVPSPASHLAVVACCVEVRRHRIASFGRPQACQSSLHFEEVGKIFLCDTSIESSLLWSPRWVLQASISNGIDTRDVAGHRSAGKATE
jgi:hypothetical protein